MDAVQYGRKTLTFHGGQSVLTSTAITEKPLEGECEEAFTARLLDKYAHQHGTIELVIKNGHPEYAIVTLG